MMLPYAKVLLMGKEEQFENISKPSRKQLNPRQAIDYNEEQEDLHSWLKNVGKDPEKYEGYSERAADNYSRRIDQFFRWMWSGYDGYTTRVTHERADEFGEQLAKDDAHPDKP